MLAAVTTEGQNIDMGTWHRCNTSHCRAGWVVHLAGEAGYQLEKDTSPAFAGMAIYNKSSDIKVPLHRFYESNQAAMADIKRCAEEEKKINESKSQ